MKEIVKMSEWISVKDKMPESGRNVLAYYVNEYGKYRIVKAFYADRFSIEHDDDEYFDYNEEEDRYYLPQGWHESIDNFDEYSSVKIRSDVTKWMQLPEPPKE